VILVALNMRLYKIAIPEHVSEFFDPDGFTIRRLERVVINTLCGNKEVLTIIGGYGMGKTHALKYIESLSRSRGLKPIYVQSPGRSFMDFYSTVMENLIDTIHDVKYQAKNPALKRALELLDNQEAHLYAKGWLLGYAIPANIRYKLGLMGNIRESLAVNLLVEVLSLALAKVKGVVILLDEVETILNQPKNTRFSYTENLRELIDGMPRNTALVVAMTPACWDDITTLNPALFRRLSSNILYLKPVRKEHLKSFLSLYFKELLNLLDEDVYDHIYDLSNGVQGEILRLTSILLEEAIHRLKSTNDRNSAKMSLEEAKQILSEHV